MLGTTFRESSPAFLSKDQQSVSAVVIRAFAHDLAINDARLVHIDAAPKRWKKEFDATKRGELKASVEFKFSQRLGDATTADETGMFLYSSDGKETHEYIHFEGLLVKRDGRWKILMEYQKSIGSRAEFEVH